jgi:hypothetical protein
MVLPCCVVARWWYSPLSSPRRWPLQDGNTETARGREATVIYAIAVARYFNLQDELARVICFIVCENARFLDFGGFSKR